MVVSAIWPYKPCLLQQVLQAVLLPLRHHVVIVVASQVLA